MPFKATIHPVNYLPDLDNAEKVNVTDVTGDTFTIERAQSPTTAKDIRTGYRITNAIFEEDIVTAGGTVDSVNGQTGDVTLDSDDITAGATNKYVTSAEKTKLSNLSGTNTGDQDLSGLVTKTTTVNSKALSGNITLTQDDVADGTTNKAYTATDKSKLAGIASGAEVNVNADWNSVSGDSQILNKPTLGTAAAQNTTAFATAAQGTKADSALQSVVAGTNVTVDATDPQNPVISASGGGGGGAVDSVNGQTGVVVLDADDVSDSGTTNKYVTAAEKTKLSNLSGTNTGDQTSVTGNAGTATKLATARNINGVAFDGTANITVADSTKVPTTTTVNGHALSSNVTVTKSDVSLGNVDNTADANKPVSTAQRDAIDAQTNIYGSSYMRTFRSALAEKATVPVDMLFIGDSKAEGTTVTAGERWLDVFRESFRVHNQPSDVEGGYGYVPACYVASTMDDQFVLTGGATAQTSATGDTHGLGKRSVTMTTTGTATITVGPGTVLGGCTSVDVVYTQNSSQGVFSVSVDGGSATNVTATNATEVIGKTYRVTGLTNTESHTIAVAWVSGTVTLHGAMLYNGDETAGIRIWESAHSGIKASDISTTTHKWWKAITTIQPQFIYYQLGRNDIANGASLSTTMTNITNEITFIRTLTTIEPTIIIGMDWKDSLASAVETYADWYAAMYDYVETDGNLGLFDLHKVMGDLSTTGENYLSLSNSDLIHATPKGQQVVADAFLAYLESFVESKREKADSVTVTGGYTSWTPTITNLSGGTLNYAVYEQIGKTVRMKLKYTLGGAGISGRPTFTLPVTAASRTANAADVINGVVDLRDASGNAYPGALANDTSTTVSLYCVDASATYASYSAVSATKPFTWASTDYILFNAYYEAA